MSRPKVPTARDIMIRSVVTLRPEMRAVEAAGVLLKHNISGAPVVDEDGKLLGLLSEYDCLRAVASSEYDYDRHDLVIHVRELMSPMAHTISPDLDLFGIAHQFVNHRFRRLPVVEGEKLVGQVSRRDALRAAYELRREIERKPYPDYPEGRRPIHFYPRKR